MLRQWFLDITTAIHQLDTLPKFALIAFFFVLACFSARDCVHAHYNAKKPGLKIVPIVLLVIWLGLASFIAYC